jgi:hypothetical protein
MKIKGPSKVGNVGRVRKKSAAKADGAAFNDALSTDEVASSNAMSGTVPLAAVSSLLGLQEIPSATEGRARNLNRAEDLLEHLDQIQRGLLLGTLPAGRLQAILKSVTSKRIPTNDANLNSIMDDIELRIKVELAKLGY